MSSAGSARRWVAEQFRRWELTDGLDESTLLVSELVANAILHAGSDPRLQMAVADGAIEVSVADDDARLPKPTEPVSFVDLDGVDLDGVDLDGVDLDGVVLPESGQGLRLVEALADEWGASRRQDGKQVWFRLGVGDWSYRPTCRCPHDHPERARLGSGRFVLHTSGPWDLDPAP